MEYNDLEYTIKTIKRNLHELHSQKRLARAKNVATFLYSFLDETSRNINLLVESYKNIASQNRDEGIEDIMIIDFTDMGIPGFLFEFRPNEMNNLKNMINMELFSSGDLLGPVYAEFEEAKEQTIVYKYSDCGIDSLFLSSIAFGQGQFVIPFEDRFYVQGFFLDQCPGDPPFTAIRSGDVELERSRLNSEHLKYLAYHVNTVIVEPNASSDVETLLMIGAQRYIEIFCKAWKNSYIIS